MRKRAQSLDFYNPGLLERSSTQPLPRRKSKRFGSFFSTDRRKTPRSYVELRCVVVGDQNIGKTSLVYRYTNNEFMEEYKQTVLDMFNVVSDTRESHFELDIWDVGGCEYDKLGAESMASRNFDVYIVCFSLVNRESFQNVELKWIPDIRGSSPFIPIILVGTQSDLKQHCDSSEFVSTSEGLALNQRIRGIKYIECSSKNGKLAAVTDVFESAVSFMVRTKAKKAQSHRCLVM